MTSSKTSEPSHRGRRYLPKIQKKNLLESSPSHLGAELVQSEQERPVFLPTIALAQFRIVLTLVSQHSPRHSRPGFFKRVTSLFKRPEAVYMAFVSQDEVN